MPNAVPKQSVLPRELVAVIVSFRRSRSRGCLKWPAADESSRSARLKARSNSSCNEVYFAKVVLIAQRDIPVMWPRARGRKWYRKAAITARLVFCSDNKDGDVIIIIATTIIIISRHGKHTCSPGYRYSRGLNVEDCREELESGLVEGNRKELLRREMMFRECKCVTNG